MKIRLSEPQTISCTDGWGNTVEKTAAFFESSGSDVNFKASEMINHNQYLDSTGKYLCSAENELSTKQVASIISGAKYEDLMSDGLTQEALYGHYQTLHSFLAGTFE